MSKRQFPFLFIIVKLKCIKKPFPVLRNFILAPCYRHPDIVTLRMRNKEEPNGMACCVEIGFQQMSVKLIKLHAYYSNSLLD